MAHTAQIRKVNMQAMQMKHSRCPRLPLAEANLARTPGQSPKLRNPLLRRQSTDHHQRQGH
eukprot:523865-Amphidinium_carterae.2